MYSLAMALGLTSGHVSLFAANQPRQLNMHSGNPSGQRLWPGRCMVTSIRRLPSLCGLWHPSRASTAWGPNAEPHHRRSQWARPGGARAHLHAAGLPGCFWPHVCQHWCVLCDASPGGKGPSQHFLRNGEGSSGWLLPIGRGVGCCPANTKYTHISEGEPRLCYDIFLGYDSPCGVQ